jgi:hypothetical protein
LREGWNESAQPIEKVLEVARGDIDGGHRIRKSNDRERFDTLPFEFATFFALRPDISIPQQTKKQLSFFQEKTAPQQKRKRSGR